LEIFEPISTLYVTVVIPLALPQNYTWCLPEHLQSLAQVGSRAEVVLRNKKYAGIITEIHNRKPDSFKPKDVLNILDDAPIVLTNQLKFWHWMAQYYMCSEGEVMQAALPTHFKLSSESVLLFHEAYGDDFSELDDEEYLLAEALLIRKELRIVEVQQILTASHVYPVIKRLIDKGVCMVWEELKEQYRPRIESYVRLAPAYATETAVSALLDEMGKAPKQQAIILSLLHFQRVDGTVKQQSVLKKAGASSAQLKALVEKGVLLVEKRTVDRIPTLPLAMNLDFVLSNEQQSCLNAIREQWLKHPVCLLHGVTGSGKTQVYMKLMEEAIAAGKQVLYLLPEIALTAQMIRRLQQYFGGYITIYHSKFNGNERVEIWNKVKSGQARIVLGARSALFLPFSDLGLVICDEEHDPSFKQQDPAPRYHGRDAAIYLASIYKAPLLLGSATPSMESYYHAQNGKYGLVTLNERFGGLALPQLEVIDTRNMLGPDRTKVIISPPLEAALSQVLQAGKQAILFQNRRGYAPYQVCQSCGWIPHCKQCDVSLTYHKIQNKLSCHYCGTAYPVLTQCGACGNHYFAQQHFGTERIEETLLELFPSARVARMDIDSVRGKYAHDQLIQQFEQQQIDILVGTQMVVKGLDFEHVSLVGILDGDAILGFADFRVNERGYQLMEQVSGRAGRKGQQGQVLVQMRNIHHPVLSFVQRHCYEDLYAYELPNREQFQYPPFTRLIHCQFRHKKLEVVQAASRVFAEGMRTGYGVYMVGPAVPVVGRVRNVYLQELLFKLPKDPRILHACKHMLSQQIILLHQHKDFRSVGVVIDVDMV
jgi:primosomal protein N' (replication factor Y)